MQSAEANLRDYYRQELLALRSDLDGFSRAYPEVARALSLHKGRAHDPHVELLIQSFAWLTGRLHFEMEEDLAAMPNALLSYLQPHLEAPVPCMTVAELEVKADGANFAKEVCLERGRQFRAEAADADGNTVQCRLRTTQDACLVPMQVTELKLLGAGDCPYADPYPQTYAILAARLDAEVGFNIGAMGQRRLRFHLNETESQAWALYELLNLNLVRVVLAVDGGPSLQSLAPEQIRWLGYAKNEAALPDNPHSQAGYRLLQEYFAFPAKFLFFDVEGVDLSKVEGRSCHIYFLLDTVLAGKPPGKTALRLNCVPLINLFSTRIEPLSIDHSRYEYRVSADYAQHRHTEIHSIDELISSGTGRPTRAVTPWFALGEFGEMDRQEYFYATRREPSASPYVAGTETYLSFLDTGAAPIHPNDELIGGRATCTNRRLPEQLRIGDTLMLEGPGPVKSVRIAAKTSAHHAPPMVGARPWALAGHLSLNHLSLVEGEGGLAALKALLRHYVGPAASHGLKNIDAIRKLDCRAVTRRLGLDAWRGFVSGLHVQLTMDRSGFEHGSAVLFCGVLHHFLSLYANVNALVETSLMMQDRKGLLKTWAPRQGVQAVL